MTTFGADPLQAELQRVLAALAAGSVGTGEAPTESRHVDLKEEAGRRRNGTVLPSQPRGETAAKALAVEAACMANTDGGGYLVVGAADDGTLIGTDLEAEWLRRRIYDLTQRQLTVSAREHSIRGVRLLLLHCPEAVEPIRVDSKVRWRVDDSCVEVDASTWHERRLWRLGWDWSAQASTLTLHDVRASALERARDYLRASGEDHALELAELPAGDLLTRLNVLTGDGHLTNAGAIAFVGRSVPAIDYIRREAAGGDSTNRIRTAARGLVEDLYDTEQAIRAVNPVRHLPVGLVSGQVRQLPDGAVRETIVNGCVHRDWSSTDPTLVEHEGTTLVVTSPGGFIGGVTPANIITHPSQPRNRALSELFASLRVAEREGIGVDRMVREMIRVGHAPPVIEEVAGPRVRTALVGDIVDEGWMRFLTTIEPAHHRNNLNSLLVLRHLVERWWVDEEVSAPVLQRSLLEARSTIGALESATTGGAPLIDVVVGTPADARPAWHLTPQALEALASADAYTGQRRRAPSRSQIAADWAKNRGRVSTTELGSIVGASPTNVGAVLKALEAEGSLAPSRPVRRGPGFYYTWVNS
ncbi:ATP-binding protein [Kineococcus arenarius]|uniref:ATP-binding protein n=1 Tax=Kineococcus sp. SYSU DK007 TaxID=3383128 RepID=UPI003D7E616B